MVPIHRMDNKIINATHSTKGTKKMLYTIRIIRSNILSILL